METTRTAEYNSPQTTKLHSQLQKSLHPLTLSIMAQHWQTLFDRTTSNQRMMVSLCQPTGEPNATFLDIRHCFPKEGKTTPTKRGLRFRVSSEDVTCLTTHMELLLRGEESFRQLDERIVLKRNWGELLISNGFGNKSISLFPTEAKFVFECLQELSTNWNWVAESQLIEGVLPSWI